MDAGTLAVALMLLLSALTGLWRLCRGPAAADRTPSGQSVRTARTKTLVAAGSAHVVPGG